MWIQLVQFFAKELHHFSDFTRISPGVRNFRTIMLGGELGAPMQPDHVSRALIGLRPSVEPGLELWADADDQSCAAELLGVSRAELKSVGFAARRDDAYYLKSFSTNGLYPFIHDGEAGDHHGLILCGSLAGVAEKSQDGG